MLQMRRIKALEEHVYCVQKTMENQRLGALDVGQHGVLCSFSCSHLGMHYRFELAFKTIHAS